MTDADLLAETQKPAYAALRGKRDDTGLAAAVNAAGVFTRPVAVPRDVFLRIVAMANFRIPAVADEAKRQGWQNVLAMVRSASFIAVAADDVQALLTLGVSDGVITAEEKAALDAAAVEPVAVTVADVSRVLNGA